MKIINDKYYTSKDIAKYCVNKTIDVIGDNNITEFIEPSAGNGAFLNFLNKPFFAYDIEPENKEIIKKDFLTLDKPYKKGCCIIGNPPYGSKLYLAQQFYKKSTTLGDFIAFILPISQLNNNITLREFDLVYSEDLGEQLYSNRKLHCCFNIYARQQNKKSKPKKLKSISICRQDSKKYNDFDYDIRMCYWGDGTVGKILKNPNEKYSGEYKIKINNPILFDKIKSVIENTDWKKEISGIAMKGLKQWQLIEVLQREIPNIN